MKAKILIIDDDLDMCVLLNRFLSRNDYQITEAHSGLDGIEKYKHGKFDIVICDYKLGDKTGHEVLKEIHSHNADAVVLIITGYSDIETAVDLIKAGAYDYISKPLIPDEILTTLSSIKIDAASGNLKLNLDKKQLNSQQDNSHFLEGNSKEAKALFHRVTMVANTDLSVIIYGETGSGKETIARAIHNMGRRKERPFIAIDCSLHPALLSDRKIFGYGEDGPTDGSNHTEGYLKLVNGGTIFLDEVANLSLDLQTLLLQAIQNRKYKKVGNPKEIPLDVRIIVSSKENLQDAYKKGKFLEELYHRFNEFSITVPALRHCKEDIPLFANLFLQKSKTETGKHIGEFDNDVMELLLNYCWPGNLKQLRNIIHRAVLLTNGSKINMQAVPLEIISTSQINKHAVIGNINDVACPTQNESVIAKNTSPAEYEAILKALAQANFNKTKAANLLNIDRETLFIKLKNYQNPSAESASQH